MQKKTKRTVAAAAGLVTVGAIGLAAVSGPMQAAFTDFRDPGQIKLEGGVLRIGDFNSGHGTYNYTETVKDMTSGDTGYRVLNVVNAGTVAMGRIDMTFNYNGLLVHKPSAPTWTGFTPLPNPTRVTHTGTTPLRISVTGCHGDWTGLTATKPNPVCNGEQHEYYPNVAGNNAVFNGATPVKLIDTANVNADNTVTPKAPRSAGYFQPYGASVNNGLEPKDKISLLFRYDLPATANNAYQGKTATGNFSLTAYQRPGVNNR